MRLRRSDDQSRYAAPQRSAKIAAVPGGVDRDVIDIGSRIVELVGLKCDPGGDWMKQMARNLLDADDGFLRGKRYLILDRDPLYTKEFREMLRGGRGEASSSARAEPEFERLRREIRALDQKRMFGSNRAARRKSSPASR